MLAATTSLRILDLGSWAHLERALQGQALGPLLGGIELERNPVERLVVPGGIIGLPPPNELLGQVPVQRPRLRWGDAISFENTTDIPVKLRF